VVLKQQSQQIKTSLFLSSKLKRWRLYDIVYKNGGQGPAEITADLSVYNDQVDVGLGNLNSKAYKAIKETTGLEMHSCKVDMVYINAI